MKLGQIYNVDITKEEIANELRATILTDQLKKIVQIGKNGYVSNSSRANPDDENIKARIKALFASYPDVTMENYIVKEKIVEILTDNFVNCSKNSQDKAFFVAKTFVDMGFDINFSDEHNHSLLWNLTDGNGEVPVRIFDFVINELHANVNIIDKKYQFSPLHISVMKEKLKLTRNLLKWGANPYLKGKNGDVPLHYNHLYYKNRFDVNYAILLTLLKRTAEDNLDIPYIDSQSDSGNTVLINESIHSGNTRAIGKLLLFGANPNIQNNLGETALICYLKSMLIKIDAKEGLYEDTHGKLFQQVANTTELFISHGSDIEQPDNKGVSCVYLLADILSYHKQTSDEEKNRILQIARKKITDILQEQKMYKQAILISDENTFSI